MRPLLMIVCVLTAAAAAWLGAMLVVLGHSGYGRDLLLSLFFILQSLLVLRVASRRSLARWRVMSVAGAAGLIGVGARVIAVNLNRAHFEGFTLIIGGLVLLQGLLTVACLIPPLSCQSSKVHQFGN